MVRSLAKRAPMAFGAIAAVLAANFLAPSSAASDYACNFVEVQCDRAANIVRVIPFRAENEECDRLRAVKDADWLVDVARHVRASGKGRTGPGEAKVLKCELAKGKIVTTHVQGVPLSATLQGKCGAVFSALVTIEEQQPRYRRVVNELNLLQDCEASGAADSIEYFADSQKVLIQWSSEQQFGVLERTVLARKSLKEAARNGR
jgi:hypothetical protein